MPSQHPKSRSRSPVRRRSGNFPSFARKDHLRKAYIEALNKEIINLREKHNNLEINTIFIGGGTPSVLESNELECLLKEIAKLNMAKDKLCSLMKNEDLMDEEIYEKFNIDPIVLEGLMVKEETENGINITWGNQKIS